MCEPILRRVDQGIIKLVIGNEKVTRERIDRHGQKHNALFTSKDGIIKVCMYCSVSWFLPNQQ